MEQYTYTDDVAINLSDASSDNVLPALRLGVFTLRSNEKQPQVKREHNTLKWDYWMSDSFGFAWGCGNQLSFYQQYF